MDKTVDITYLSKKLNFVANQWDNFVHKVIRFYSFIIRIIFIFITIINHIKNNELQIVI